MQIYYITKSKCGSINPDDIVYADISPLPAFTSDVKNLTVTAGRTAQLTCKVENLGNYKVTLDIEIYKRPIPGLNELI